jgi:hypothetical protein
MVKITHFGVMKFDKPYFEAFWGIENLFKLFRINAYNRLTYIYEPDVLYLFGIK